MTPEEIADIFRDMEDYLASSMKRNLSSHKAQELTEGFEWKQWQAMQLRSLNEYRCGLGPAVNAYFDKANPEIEAMIRDQFKEAAGKADQIYSGVVPGNSITSGGDNFFEINKPRVNQLVDEALNGVNGLRYAVINKAGTDYTSIIQRADFLYQTGAMTLDQSVDMASKSFLEKGLSCVVYANGATVGIASYVEMALRTSSRKTVMTAEGAKRAEWGEFLVVVPSIGSTCPLCMAWQAMILVDDVYAGGRPDGVHGLLSTAMEAGLLHPNCRHKPSTYFEGISTVPTESPEARTAKQYAAEQRQRVIERNIRKYKRLEAGSLDSSNVTKYAAKKNEWQAEMRKHLDENPELRRKPSREKSYGPGTTPTPPTTPTTPPVAPPVAPAPVKVPKPPKPAPITVQPPKPTLAQKIEQIKDGRTVLDLDTTKKIGAAIREDFMPKITEHEAKRKDLMIQRDAANDKMEANYAINKAKWQNGEIDRGQLNTLTAEDSKEYDELTRQMYQINMDESKIQRNAVLESLEKIRPMGSQKFADNSMVTALKDPGGKTSKALREAVKKAADCYPTEWLDKSKIKSRMTFSEIKKNGQVAGSYNSFTSTIKTIDISDTGTVVHEIGHRMEDVLSSQITMGRRSLKKLEEDFYNARTIGEDTGILKGYDCHGRNDKWQDRYTGRAQYLDGSFEVFSTGMNNLFYPGQKNLIYDEDFMDFILGILGGL